MRKIKWIQVKEFGTNKLIWISIYVYDKDFVKLCL